MDHPSLSALLVPSDCATSSASAAPSNLVLLHHFPLLDCPAMRDSSCFGNGEHANPLCDHGVTSTVSAHYLGDGEVSSSGHDPVPDSDTPQDPDYVLAAPIPALAHDLTLGAGSQVQYADPVNNLPLPALAHGLTPSAGIPVQYADPVNNSPLLSFGGILLYDTSASLELPAQNA